MHGACTCTYAVCPQAKTGHAPVKAQFAFQSEQTGEADTP